MSSEQKVTERELNRIEVSIVWQDGKVMLNGPANPLAMMKVLGDALSVMADEFVKMGEDKGESMIATPGPGVLFTNKEILDKAHREILEHG